MIQRQEGDDWTEADELGLGRSLFSQISGHVQRGEDIPDDLYSAAEGFLQTSALMAHQQDYDAGQRWMTAFQSFDDGLRRLMADAQMRAEGVESEPLPFEYQPPRAAMEMSPSLFPEYEGVEPTDEMRGRAFALDPEAVRNHSILTAAPEIDESGRPVVTDSDGMVWDLSESLAEFQKPEVREALRQSLQGVVPGPEILSNTLGAMPLAHAALQGVSKAKGALGLPETANIRTAQPGYTLPWTLPIEGFEEKIKDPLWTRALLQTQEEMAASGELDPTALETLTRTVAGLADFVIFSKGLSAATKGLGSAIVKTGVEGIPGAAGKALAAGRSPISFPLNTHFGRLAADFMSYEVGTKAFNDTTTISEDALAGFNSAMLFGSAGVLARFSRVPFTKLLMKPAVPASMDTMEGLHKQIMKSNERTLLGALKKIELKPLQQDAVKKTLDSFLTGAYVHAYHEAQASDNPSFETFWKGLLSPNALATGFGFALGTGLQAGSVVRRQMDTLFRSPTGRQMMRNVAERLASPRASEDVRAVWDKFEQYRETAPNVFKGLVKTNQSARDTLAAREANLQAIRAQFGWHPEREAPPSAAETRVREIPVVQEGTSAVERFRTAIAVGEGALAAGAYDVKRPTYELGELPKQLLSDLGFAEHRHALNAVNKYLRENEGAEAEQFKRLAEVPRAVWLRALESRDKKAEPEGPRQLTLEEAAKTYETVAGHPEYRDLAPTEAVAKAIEKKTKGRPSLKEAIERVRSGKKTVEWLAEKFPEGREGIESGKPLSAWEDRFVLKVRTAWNFRAKKNARAVADRVAASGMFNGEPADIVTFLRAIGGVAGGKTNEAGDFWTLFRPKETDKKRDVASGESFLGALVHPPGKNKGRTPDYAREAAEEAGYLPSGSTISDLIDAVSNTLGGDRHFARKNLNEVVGEHLAAHDAETLSRWRRGIESGEAPLPKDPAERSKFIEDTFAGDPNYAGMKPAEIEAQVMEIRRQNLAGDPGAMLAAPKPSARDLTLSFAEKAQRLTDELRALEVVDPDATRGSPASIEAVMRLVDGDTSLLEGRVPEGERASFVERARAAQADMRSMFETVFEPGTKEREALDALFDAADATRAGYDMKPETVDFFRRMKALDEYGNVRTDVLETLQRDAIERAWNQVKGEEELGDFSVFSGIPIAFAGQKFSRVEHWMSWGRVWDNPTFKRFMERPAWRKAFRAVTSVGALPGINVFRSGPLSKPQSRAQQGLMQVTLQNLGRQAGITRNLELRAAHIANALMRPFAGRRLPLEHSEFFVEGVSSGRFVNARSAADFEAMKPGTGYMFRVYQDYAEVMASIEKLAGPEGLGWLQPEQIAAWGGGKYLTKATVREQVQRLTEAAANGEVPVGDIGRTMLREDGNSDSMESAMRIYDAPYLIGRSVESWSVLLRSSAAWFEPMRGGAFVSESELRKMHPLDAEDYALAGVRITEARGQKLLDAMEDLANAGQYHRDTLLTSYRLQLLERSMAKEGEPPQQGKMAYSPQLAEMIRTWLGEGKQGPVYLPKSLLEEVGIITEELFTSPGESTLRKIGTTVDLAGSWMKRGFTALRPAALVLDYASSAWNNHVGRGNSIWDFFGGHLGIKSTWTHRSAMDGQLYFRWLQEGSPTGRGAFQPPEGWTMSDWGRMKMAKDYVDIMGGSTSAYAVLGPELATAMGISTESPAQLRAALEVQLEEHAAKRGLTLGQRDRMTARIAQIARSSARGLEHVDESVAKLMDESDPGAHARAMQQFGGARHLIDLFMFKYPVFLRMKHENPDVPLSRLRSASAEITSNASDTSAAARRWMSLHTPWGDAAFMKAQGRWKIPGTGKSIPKAPVQMALAQLLRNRFYTYPQTMAPQMLKWHLTNPLGMALAAAAVAGLRSGIWALMGDDERKRLMEEMAASRAGAVSWMALRETEREHYEKALAGSKVGIVGGGLRLPDKVVDAARSFWRGLPDVLTGADPFVIPMPKHGGESRSSSVSELMPTGFLVNRWKNQAGAVSAMSGAGEGKSRDALQGVSRILGLTAQATFGTSAGLLTGDDPLIQALGGKGSVTEAFASKVFAVLGSGGVMYPKLGMFTPEGIFIGENVALNGQSWREAMRGVERFHNPVDPASSLASSGLRLLWPSRALYARPPLNASEDAWAALLGELYGPGFTASSEAGRDKTRAARWGLAQMAVMLGDLYDLHFDQAGEPGASEITLDERVVGATLELMQHTQESLAGGYQIETGYEPKGVLLQAIKGLPAGVQPHAIDFLRRWLQTETFTQDGMSWLMLAGNGREMSKALFRQGMMNALSDPSGSNLLAWWSEQIASGDPEVMGQLAPLVNDVRQPSPGSAAFKTWARIMAAYAAQGLRLPPLPAEGQKAVEDILGERKASRTLQGGPSFENVLRKRQPSQAESAFLPQ